MNANNVFVVYVDFARIDIIVGIITASGDDCSGGNHRAKNQFFHVISLF
jgi:hypothetical protein